MLWWILLMIVWWCEEREELGRWGEREGSVKKTKKKDDGH